MKTAIAIVLSILGAAWLCGCDRPSYKGRSVSDWIARADDADDETKKEALEALSHLKGKDSAAWDVLDREWSRQGSPQGKLKLGLMVWPRHKAETIAAGKATLKASVEKNDYLDTELIIRLAITAGQEAKELIPDLDAAITKEEADGGTVRLDTLRDAKRFFLKGEAALNSP